MPTTWSNFRTRFQTRSPRSLPDIHPFPKSRARIAYSTISDAIIAVRLEWGGPDDLLTPLARHKRDRNEWRTRVSSAEQCLRCLRSQSLTHWTGRGQITRQIFSFDISPLFYSFTETLSRRVRKGNTIRRRRVEITGSISLDRSPLSTFFNTHVRLVIDTAIFQSIISFCLRTTREKYPA